MGWTLTDSVTDFRAAAGALLTAHPAEHSVLLTVAERLTGAGPTTFGGAPASFGWWRADDDSPVAGAFLLTPPYPLRLSVMPESAATALAAEVGPDVGSVAGLPANVDAFAGAWTARFGGSTAVRRHERMYRLGDLTHPSTPGSSRPATAADRDLLVAWWERFFAELGEPHGDIGSAVDSRLQSGRVWLWEDGGGPVSVAGASAVLSGMARVGPVYTPPNHRRNGYAGAVTAAASADAIARGAEQVLLYTDLANPTSNSVYQRIGYRPLADEVVVDLTR